METLKKLTSDQTGHLRDIYKINYPLHVSTCSTIELFIQRLQKQPEYNEKVYFLSINDDWTTNGTFVMIDENRIFCNTLESFPFVSLRKILLSIELDDEITFVNLRDVLRPVIFDILRIHNFEIISDVGSRCFLMRKEELKNLEVEAPEGFELKPLTADHVKKIDDAWPGKFRSSKKFIEDAIKYNSSMGLYDKSSGELIAWNMRINNGSLGIGQVDSGFVGNFFGHIAVIALAVKVAKDYDTDIHFEIRNDNYEALKSAKNSQLQIVDTQSWISVRRKRLETKPMWGHL